MPLSQDFSDRPKKKLKFYCTNCRAEIITLYLEPGDEFLCPYCKVKTIVPREPTPWGVSSVVKFTLAYIFFIIPFMIIAAIIGLIAGEELRESTYGDIMFHAFDFIYYFVPIGLIFYSVVKRHKNNFFKALNLQKLTRVEFLRWMKICLLISISVIAFSEFIGHLSPLGKFIPEQIPLYEDFRKGYIEAIWFSLMALMAPLQEELIFRGYVYQGLRNRFGITTSAAVVSTIFVLLHGPGLAFNLVLLFFIAIVAVLLIVVRIKTGSLTKCILLHQIFNTFSVIYLWIWIWLFGLESLTG